jgi:putative flippase GtrA
MTLFIRNPQERKRFYRFLVVGSIGAVIDFGVMNLLTRIFYISLVLAGTISFIIAILSNFTWNRYWTYPDSRSKSILGQLLEFSIVNIAGIIIRIPILYFLEPPIYQLISSLPITLTFVDTNFYSNNITLAIAVTIVLFWNFFVNRFWTYSDV